MRVFVYEHLCSGAFAGQPGADSLRREGLAMLSAVLSDLALCPGVQPLTLVEPDLVDTLRANIPGREVYPLQSDAAHLPFRHLARGADFTLVIAPEFGGVLAERCSWASAKGSRLLGPTPDAVRLTGDKLALAQHLSRRGVPTPPTEVCARSSDPIPAPWEGEAPAEPGAAAERDSELPLEPDTRLGGSLALPGARDSGKKVTPSAGSRPRWTWPVVCKPRFGAGSQATALVKDEREYRNAIQELEANADLLGEGVVQPHVPGKSVSVSFLAGPGRLVALPACEQHLSRDGRFSYLGGRLPLAPALTARAQRLAERAARAVPGLAGYFGVDLVLGDSADGCDDVVIEINPRLTTSYVGLRKLAKGNLMQALLALQDGTPQPLAWHDREVRFDSTGRVD
jgi:predicted ATP-grasp superfamily ATP-dependent carboligase